MDKWLGLDREFWVVLIFVLCKVGGSESYGIGWDFIEKWVKCGEKMNFKI